MVGVLLLVEMAVIEAALRSFASQTFAIVVRAPLPAANRRTWTCGFDYLKKTKHPPMVGVLLLVEMAVIEAALRSFASQTFAIIVRAPLPAANRRTWTCGFDYLKKTKHPPVVGILFLVEMAVIETASENPSSGVSTSVADYLKFPLKHVGRQTCFSGSL